MINRQRIAKWFLYLTCLVVLTCVTQRMAGLHSLQLALGSPNVNVSQPTLSGDDKSEPTSSTSCELSAKSLLAASPVMFETVLFGMGMLLALLTPIIAARLRFPPPRAISPTTLRVHLRLCVFHE
ncbi:copper resistance protein [Serratia sp. UGAL515B_01]|uniref:copper resistance protein n=1 Tax=Serratia sp. UGAL515B_01 TaxID=2986763 RepID=UPI0029555686|nr:copper resistance protein [Serratia sp. UGAL515B_01]WON75700.1 copper resistance protein [Serratia sp. UGAL515B_01]